MHDAGDSLCANECSTHTCIGTDIMGTCIGNATWEHMPFESFPITVPVFGLMALRGRCLDNNGPNFGQGKQLQTWDCNSSGAQAFNWNIKTTQIVDLYTRLCLSNWNGKCLDVAYSGLQNGAKVQMYDCNGGLNQNWQHNRFQ